MNKNILKWGGILAAGCAFVDAFILERYFFEINTQNIGKKASDKKVKLLLLTDLHFKKVLYPNYKKLVKKVIEINPDLILIAGDLVDKNGTYAPAKEFFDLLPYSIPKVGIMGNHDYKSEVSLSEFKQLYQQNNGVLLVNESQPYVIDGSRIIITGLDDFIEGEASFADAVEQVGSEKNHVMLIHSPKQQDKVLKQIKKINKVRTPDQQLNIQYIFAGHNHGGQIRFLGYAPVMPEKSGKYMNGWYNRKPPYLYVSKGFGTTTLPFRFGARAEITLFNLGV